MTVLPAAPGVTRAVLNYTMYGIKAANVLHFTQPPGPDSPDPLDLATSLASWWNANVKVNTNINTVLTSVTATDLSPLAAPSVEYTTGLPSPGSGAGDGLPNNCALVISLKTAIRGRSYRGRIYVPGINETDTAANAISSTRRDLFLAAYQKLIVFTGGVGAPDWTLVVLSYFNAGAMRASPVATPVVSMSADTRIDTQRRRMR